MMLNFSAVTVNYFMLGNISIGPVILRVNYICSFTDENSLRRAFNRIHVCSHNYWLDALISGYLRVIYTASTDVI